MHHIFFLILTHFIVFNYKTYIKNVHCRHLHVLWQLPNAVVTFVYHLIVHLSYAVWYRPFTAAFSVSKDWNHWPGSGSYWILHMDLAHHLLDTLQHPDTSRKPALLPSWGKKNLTCRTLWIQLISVPRSKGSNRLGASCLKTKAEPASET